MQINEDLLKRLEKLSSLEVEDKQKMLEELGKIVGFIDNISNIDTSGVEAVFSMNDKPVTLREDVAFVDESINNDILSIAPSSKDHFFVVPKIIG